MCTFLFIVHLVRSDWGSDRVLRTGVGKHSRDPWGLLAGQRCAGQVVKAQHVMCRDRSMCEVERACVRKAQEEGERGVGGCLQKGGE